MEPCPSRSAVAAPRAETKRAATIRIMNELVDDANPSQVIAQIAAVNGWSLNRAKAKYNRRIRLGQADGFLQTEPLARAK